MEAEVQIPAGVELRMFTEHHLGKQQYGEVARKLEALGWVVQMLRPRKVDRTVEITWAEARRRAHAEKEENTVERERTKSG